jgi:rhomboid protease GluP
MNIKTYYQYHPLTATIILINVMMGFVVLFSGGFTTLNLISWGALFPPLIQLQGEWYRLLTSMLLHGSLVHLLLNMYALYFIGGFMERLLGTYKYLMFYVIAGLTASLLVYFLGNPMTVTIGASGAIFGLMGGLLALTFLKPLLLPPATTNNIRFIALINIIFTFTIPNISIYGHLGGLLSGILLTFILFKK